MAYGFPAYHEETLDLGKTQHDSQQLVMETLKLMGIGFSVLSSDTLEGKIPMTLFTGGDKVKIRVERDGKVWMRSECPLPTQCFDMGRNKRNVRSFFKKLGEQTAK